MAAAARLAVAGQRVTVYERAATYGGSVGRFERDGFVFDTGPGLLHLPAVYRDLFVKTGKEPLESRVRLGQVDPASRHVFADGTDVRLPNASRGGVVSALDAALGAGAGERWGSSSAGPGTPGTARAVRCWRSRCGRTGGCSAGIRIRPYGSDGCSAAPGRPRRSRRSAPGSWPTRGWRRCWTVTPCRTGSTRGAPRRAPPCCRIWSRPSAAGMSAAACGSWPARCTNGAWPAGWSSSSAPR